MEIHGCQGYHVISDSLSQWQMKIYNTTKDRILSPSNNTGNRTYMPANFVHGCFSAWEKETASCFKYRIGG